MYKNMYSKCTVLFLCLLIFILNGCFSGKSDNRIVARIDKSTISLDDINERLKHLPDRYREYVKKRKNDFIQELINDTLLYQAALDEGLDRDKEVKKVLDAAKTKILIARYLKDNVDDKVEITREDIIKYYRENVENFRLPQVIRASHILVDSKEEAEEVKKMLEGGAAFGETAKAKSIDPSSGNGGDIGYFSQGQLMPEFEKGINGLEIGEISGIIKTKLGYHIVMVTDKKPVTYRSVEEVKDKIEPVVKNNKRRAMFNELIKDLRDRAKIEINESTMETLFKDEDEKVSETNTTKR